MATRSFISPLRRFRKLANIKNQSLSSTENGEKFIWDGTLKHLKKFVAGDLKLLGKWTSPCGETKLFTSPLVCLKWKSKTSKWDYDFWQS